MGVSSNLLELTCVAVLLYPPPTAAAYPAGKYIDCDAILLLVFGVLILLVLF